MLSRNLQWHRSFGTLQNIKHLNILSDHRHAALQRVPARALALSGPKGEARLRRVGATRTLSQTPPAPLQLRRLSGKQDGMDQISGACSMQVLALSVVRLRSHAACVPLCSEPMCLQSHARLEETCRRGPEPETYSIVIVAPSCCIGCCCDDLQLIFEECACLAASIPMTAKAFSGNNTAVHQL